MRKKTPQEMIQDECGRIIKSICHWEYINQHGCNDPWCNMNLCRNHILSAKANIREICEAEEIGYPDEYFLPTPPEVDNLYMADLKKSPKRTERVLYGGRKAVTKKKNYDRDQFTLDL